MSFVRPEARAALWRWREVMAGAAACMLGAWWLLGTDGVLPWIGGVVLIGGLGLVAAGVQRGRFRGQAGGPGILRVNEGQIAYFGPLTGGVVALSELQSVSFDPGGRPGHWVLGQPGQPDLAIPVNAEGADALFDVFSSLPGMRTEPLLAAMRAEGGPRRDIWRRDRSAPLLGRPDRPVA